MRRSSPPRQPVSTDRVSVEEVSTHKYKGKHQDNALDRTADSRQEMVELALFPEGAEVF